MHRALVVVFLLATAGCGGGGSSSSAVPSVVAAPSSGSIPLYVANVRLANIVHVDLGGNALFTLSGGPDPEGVAADDAGNLYVAGDNKSILVYSAQTGGVLNTITDAQIGGLHGVAVTPGPSPTIFVMDTLLSQILGFAGTARGESTPLYTIPISPLTLGTPIAVAIDRNAQLYVLAGGGKNLIAPSVSICPAGQYICSKTNVIPSSDASGIAVDASGNIYLSTGTSIVQYAPTGPLAYQQSATKITTGLCGVTALAFGAGRLVAANTCTAPGDSNAQLIAYDPTTFAMSATIGGSSTQLNISRDSRVAVQPSGSNAGTIYVANVSADIITGYCNVCQGNTLPSLQISTGHPGLAGVQALFFSGAYLYTADSATPAISIYRAPSNSATGNLQPASIARIIGTNAQLCGVAYVLVDVQARIFVANACSTGNYVSVFPPLGATQGDYNPTPLMIIGTPGACGVSVMCNPQQMVPDAQNHLYVTNYGSAVDPYNAGSILEFDTGTGALLANIVGPDIHNPSGIALDPNGNIATLSNLSKNGQPEMAVFSPPGPQANPNIAVSVTPLYKITGANTLIGNATNNTPFPQMVIDRSGTIYINEFNDILVFGPGATNNAPPSKVLAGTGISGGTGLALGGLP